MDNLIKQLEAFVPYNEQEERDLSVMLDWARCGADVLTRKNKTAHFSASAWIVSPDRKSTLMCFHNIYNSWSWMGGHADGDADLKHVVVKEIGEECGLSPDKLHFLDDGIFSVEILTVNGHEKRGEYVPSHLHLNVTYLWKRTLHLTCKANLTKTRRFPGSGLQISQSAFPNNG